MARVLLIGRGPLPCADHQHTGFAQLRTRHFRDALQEAGHHVTLRLITDDHATGLIEDTRAQAVHADVVVSAGPHRPAAVAIAAAADRPLFIDLPGDPLAELQALVRAPGPPIPRARIAAVHALVRGVLARADHLSVISERQKHATMGQLALLGRGTDTPVPVDCIPIAHDFPLPPGQPRAIPESGPVRLLLSGAFAPWLDDQALARGLVRALEQQPQLEVLVTGGGVAGHYTAGFERFATHIRQSPVAHRVQLHGWVPHGALPAIFARAHVGLCLDRPGAESTLGSRTRVLLFAWLGLHVVASAETELVADLVAHDLATALPVDDDGTGIADVLVQLVSQPPSPDRAAAATAHLARRYAPSIITRPVLDFVAQPTRSPAVPEPIAAVAAELEAVRSELAAVHGSPTWRVLSRLHRLLR